MLRALLLVVVSAFLATGVPSAEAARAPAAKTSVQARKKPMKKKARRKAKAKRTRKSKKKARKSAESNGPRRPMP